MSSIWWDKDADGALLEFGYEGFLQQGPCVKGLVAVIVVVLEAIGDRP